MCGHIDDGISFRPTKGFGGVMSFADFEKIYFKAKRYRNHIAETTTSPTEE